MVRADRSTLSTQAAAPPARRSLYVAALVTSGLLLARNTPAVASHWWFLAAAMCAIPALATRGWTCRVLLALAVLATSGGWITLRALELSGSDIARHLGDDQRLITIEGMVIQTPRLRTERPGRLSVFLPSFEASTMIRLDVARLLAPGGLQPASGELLVFVGADVRRLSAGDRVRMTGMARAIEPATNPGEPDRLLWARATGVSGSMRIQNSALIVEAVTEADWLERSAAVWRRFAASVRARASAWLADDRDASQSDGPVALLRALFLGQRDESLRDIGETFERLGLAHVLAISGLHLTLMGWVMRQLVRTPGARPWVESLIVVVLIGLYLLVIPVRAPVFRAAITLTGFLIADASGRRYDRLTTLGWVYIVALAWQPMELWSAGFQLSFGVVAALLTLAGPLRALLFGASPPRDEIGWSRAVFEHLKEAAAASLCAWAVATPLVAFHMGVFSPLGAPVTVLFMPLFFALMCAGYIAMLVSAIIPATAAWTAPVIIGFSSLIDRLAATLDGLPGVALYIPALSIPSTILAIAIIVWWLVPMPFDVAAWRVRARWGATVAAACWLAASLVGTGLPKNVALRIDTIDVGDGSCHLIRSGRDAMLYDCGSLRLAMGEREIPRALRRLGAARISTIVISHPNIDHYAAFPDIAPRFGVRRALVGQSVVLAAERDPAGPVAITLDRLRRAGIEIRPVAAGDAWMLGSATVEVISPQRGARWKFDNDASLVVLVRAPVLKAAMTVETGRPSEHRLLLCGDIQRQGMVWALDARPGLQADILEAPHHGSAHDAAIDFVRDIRPAVVIQSTGESRLNDPRWASVRAELEWWSTPASGAISILCLSDGSREVFGWRTPQRPGLSTELAPDAD